MELYLQIFFTTLALSFGMLHLILYYYNRTSDSNLYFAVFLILYALNIFFDYQAALSYPGGQSLLYLRLHRAVMPYNSLFLLLFLYSAFNYNIPTYFWFLTAALVVTGFFTVLEPVENFIYVQVPLLAVAFEAARVSVTSVIRKHRGARLIGTGFLLLLLFSSYDFLMDLDLIGAVAGIRNGYPFGFLLLILCTSVYLARDFAHVNRSLLDKERENREMLVAQEILEMEDRRKSRELMEARNVQLSLLPECIPDLKNYEFCFDMRPATEVGGDYYDYLISDNGEISVAIGDATSHGMKAGMMVSIMKSLFLTQVTELEGPEFLNSSSRIIKQMELKNLFMALMIVKIRGDRLTITSAGIPPLFIHRKASNSVQEIKIKGMPLGAVESFPYRSTEIHVNSGDTVLLMTDGLTELFNSDRQSFGSKRVKDIFSKYADEPVDEIVNRLIAAGREWTGGKPQDDDMTFVSFRYKGAPGQ